MANWRMLDGNPATVKIVTAADGALYQLHNTGKIWRYIGTPLTGWELLDQNPATVDVIAAADVLYQKHRDGKIWQFTGTPLTGWAMLDQNPQTAQVIATTGQLYQRHYDGKIWRFTGTPITGWQLIDQNPATIEIVASERNLYQRHRDGKIWRYTGTPIRGWELIGDDRATIRIVVSDDDSLYQLRNNGHILKYTGTPLAGWQVVDHNPATTQIAAGNGGSLFQKHRDGKIWQYTGAPVVGWRLLDQNPATSEIAVGAPGTIYQRHVGGAIFRSGFTGDMTLTLELTRVRCVDETEHEGIWPFEGEGIANDAMRLKVINTTQKSGRSVEQNEPAWFHLGDNWQDGRVVPMAIELCEVRLSGSDPLPMSVNTVFVLVEEDWFGDLTNIEHAIREYARITREVHGTLSSIIGQLGGGGWQIGSIIGSVASIVEPGIAELVLAAANDVFPVTDLSILVPDRDVTFAPGAEAGTLRFSGHGGEYEISFAWRVVESVPPRPEILR